MKTLPKFYQAPNGVEKPLAEHLLLVALTKETDAKTFTQLLAKTGFSLAKHPEQEAARFHWQAINQAADRYFIQSKAPLDDENLDILRKTLGNLLAWTGPVYGDASDPHTLVAPLPNVLVLRRDPNSRKALKEIGRQPKVTLDKERSELLCNFEVYQVEADKENNAFTLRAALVAQGIPETDVLMENQPFLKAICSTPNDPNYPIQWNMTQVSAPCAWDKTKGVPGVIIAILDEGCDLSHPDLVGRYTTAGINQTYFGNHGTACAGIAAATYNNAAGVAGLAGEASILSRAITGWTDVSVATNLHYAALIGAKVISMSFGVYDSWGMWNYSVIDPEISFAHGAGVVLVAATGNENLLTDNRYPGKHPLVMAVGGSDQIDKRKTPASPDGEGWGANAGQDVYLGITTGVSVVAPCVRIPTTDIQGGSGYSSGNYFLTFNGTSSATPLVAGLAGLIRSQYPGLTNIQVRQLIEKTADKVGGYAYTANPNFPTSTYHPQMGYGRINACKALSHAEVMIRDYPLDPGSEPSNAPGGDFWSKSDIVVRPFNDNVFNPSNPSQSQYIERGQENFIYVRVKNTGPSAALGVTVNCRINAYVGLGFVYPADWTLVNPTHVAPTAILNNFVTINPGASVIAKFKISAAQSQQLWGWQNSNGWHPCILAEVHASNDYSFHTAGLVAGGAVVQRNNFAQRNLTVVDMLLNASPWHDFPFVIGSPSRKASRLNLVVQAKDFPDGTRPRLRLDGVEEIFPLVDFSAARRKDDQQLTFEERSKTSLLLGDCKAEVIFEKGSSISLQCGRRKLDVAEVKGGRLIIEEGERFIELEGDRLEVELEAEPGTIHALAVRFDSPKQPLGRDLEITAFQRDDQGRILGGATAIYKS